MDASKTCKRSGHLIDTGHSNKTELLITTNCTVPIGLVFNKTEVKITLSIDGVDKI